MKIMNLRRERSIVIIIWGMLVCFNSFVCILFPQPHIISWVVLGFSIGCLFVGLISNSTFRLHEDLINSQRTLIIRQQKILDKIKECWDKAKKAKLKFRNLKSKRKISKSHKRKRRNK